MELSNYHTVAQSLNSELGINLGTLVYLPWDIRENIYRLVIVLALKDCKNQTNYHVTRALGSNPRCRLGCLYQSWCFFGEDYHIYSSSDHGDLDCYQLFYPSRRVEQDTPFRIVPLEDGLVYRNDYGSKLIEETRLSSITIREEFDSVFFSLFTLSFACAAAFSRFMDKLSFSQQQCICRMEFEMCNAQFCHMPQKPEWRA